MTLTSLDVHFKAFGTDGVSLQAQELSAELQRRGHRVLFCACDVPGASLGLRLDELSYQSSDAINLRSLLFRGDQDSAAGDGAGLVEDVMQRASRLRRRLERYVDEQGIQLLHVRNLMSLPYNLPATVAIYDLAVRRPDLAFLLQHHDLYWEGPNARTFRTPYSAVQDLMARVMCPNLPNASHVLINPIAAEALKARTGISGVVIPDGFDFDRRVPELDDAAFRASLSTLTGDAVTLDEDDLVVSMPARVAINKAIEIAIQFTAAVQERRVVLEDAASAMGPNRRRFTADSRIALLLPQGEDVQDNRAYLDRLVRYADTLGVTVMFGGGVVVPDRRWRPGDAHHVPFYATYRSADIVCYPPEHEGFGNQAIETVWARRSLVVLEYPVFKRFVASHIPNVISLGDVSRLQQAVTDGSLHQVEAGIMQQAADAAIAILLDPPRGQREADENFQALRAFCGIDVVATTYERLYEEMLAHQVTRAPG